MSRPTCQIMIIGCGIGGLATAIGLRKAGHEVLIFERMRELPDVAGGVQAPPNASKCLRHLGVLEAVEAIAVQSQAIILRSFRDGKKLSKLRLVPDMKDKYESPFLNIHRNDLRSVLLERAQSLGAEIKLGSQIVNIDFAATSVRLSNGRTHEADVILGGDGDRSISRQALLGYSDAPCHSGDQVVSIALDTEIVRKHEDLKSFVEPAATNVWFGPDAHVVAYMVRRDGDLHMILSRSEEKTKIIQPRPQPADLDELRDYFKHWDSKYIKLLDTAKSAVKWTLTETAEPPTWRHEKGHFALLGDAAHAMLPYLAQGAAQALEDAVVLGALFENMQCKSQIPDVLAMYEQVRRSRALEMKKRSRAMRDTNGMLDGPAQQERDRQLLEDAPFEGYPNPWLDPVAQEWMFGYDAYKEGEDAWNIYLESGRPGTTDLG